jgi:predicted transcriptional regulator
MSQRALLLSIRPKYAELIFEGKKTVELRKTRPRAESGDLVLVYVSAPVKSLLGAFQVARVIEAHPRQLWRNVSGKCGVGKSEFNDYFGDAQVGFGIVLRAQWKLESPVSLTQLRNRRARFQPPQVYHYLSGDDLSGFLDVDALIAPRVA